MRRISFLLALLVGAAASNAARAIDINPSKNNQPPSFWQSGGNKFSIFNGDPKRIQRANEVDPKAFDSKVELTPNPLALQSFKGTPNPSIKLVFSVHNHGKKTYTLSFPNAQRWDFRILDPAGTVIYTYSENCEFEQKVGSTMMNNDDRVVYTETVEFDDLSEHLSPGVYTVQTVLANYPEIHSEAKLTVAP